MARIECEDTAFQRHFKKVHKRLLTVHTYCESSKSLEGDHGKDRVRLCRLSMSFQERPYQKLFFHLKLQESEGEKRALLDDKI